MTLIAAGLKFTLLWVVLSDPTTIVDSGAVEGFKNVRACEAAAREMEDLAWPTRVEWRCAPNYLAPTT